MVSVDDVQAGTEARMRGFASGDGLPRTVSSAGLPPGPRWPALVQTMALLRFRHQLHPWLHRRYGDVFTLRLVPGGRPLVMTSRPEHAKEIFAADPEVFHAGKGNAILGPIMGQHSLLLQDSVEHQRARKLIMPAFNGHALRGYRDLVARVAREEVDTWRDGEEFRSLDRMNRLTLEVILRVVFGVTDERRLAALRPCVNRTVEIGPVVLLGWAYPRLQSLPPWSGVVANQRELDRLMHAEIRERRAASDLAERTDVLSRLIQVGADDAGGAAGADRLSDVELRDQLVTLLLAGHETTATALAWALWELGRADQCTAGCATPETHADGVAGARRASGPPSLRRLVSARLGRRSPRPSTGRHTRCRHPELHERAQQAAHEGDHAYLEAVLKESMRLHPVIPMVVRTLTRPARVAGLDLPRGATIGPSIILAHTDEQNHPHPERFDPQRFVDGNPPVNTWIPFGGGVRRCVGAGFAQMEGAVVLAEVLSRHDVRAAGADRPKVRNITSVPRRGARIRVRSARPR